MSIIHATSRTTLNCSVGLCGQIGAEDWYADVLELRRHAEEYRRRARGTHFTRDHLAQLYARNAELWDAVSNSSVTTPVEQSRCVVG